jgi:hypothetical protein
MAGRHRRVFQLALAFAVALGSLVPAEHIHEGDHHHPTVAHRHFAAHPHSATEIGDPDERVIWLNNVYLHATPCFQLTAVLAVLARPFATDLDSVEWRLVPSYDAAPAHGPPKTVLVPRAPPLPA